MYRISILDKTNNPVTTIPEFDTQIRSFSRVINKAGGCLFAIDKASPYAIQSNFSLFNRVVISRWNGTSFEKIWAGYIESIIENEGQIEIGCRELINLFDKRLTGNLTLTGGAGVEIFAMLASTNADDDTGITAGTNSYISNLDQKVDKKTLLDTWEDIAKSEGSEFEIDLDFNLNLGKLGTDKTSTIKLIYDETIPETNTLNETRINETGAKVANRIIGIGKKKDGTIISSTSEDTQSINENGLQEKVISFNDAESVAALQDLVDGELVNLKDGISNPEVRPKQLRTVTNIVGETKTIGIDVSDIALGDIVKLCYNNQWTTIDEDRRIVAYTVTLDDTGAENISLRLNKTTQNKELVTSDQEDERDLIKNQRQLQNRVFNI